MRGLTTAGRGGEGTAPRKRAAGLPAFCLLVVPASLVSCNAVGPASLSSGRGVYNEVIRTTEDEQLLNVIVRQRYGETFGMLSVNSVTANVSVSASAGASFRAWGSAADVSGNLVPLSAGVAYEENPTISYVPRAGEKHMGSMLSRMTLDEVVMIADATPERGLWLREAIASINGVLNPRVDGDPDAPEFDRVIDVYERLLEAHVANFGRTVATKEAEPRYFFSIYDYAGAHEDDVRAFLDVLGIEGVTIDGGDIFLPARWSLGQRTSDAIDIETRSAFDVLRSFGTVVEVPAPHLEAGIVEPRAWEAPEPHRFITIRTSEKRPHQAAVAIRFRGWWFYIDATDARSKRAFGLIRMLLDVQFESQSAPQIPIITIPAGR